MTKTNRTYCFFIIYTVLSFVLSNGMLRIPFFASLEPMVLNTVGQLVIFSLTLILGIFMFKEAPVKVFGVNPVALGDILIGALLAFLITPIANLLSLISTVIFPNNVSEVLTVAYDYPLFLSIVSICIIPAVFEELIFRGIVFGGFKNLSLTHACVLGGLIFAIAHFDPQQALYTFFVGTLFCYIVYRTKSVLPTMITHFCLNFSQVMLSRMSLEEAAGTPIDIPLSEAIGQLLPSYFLLSLVAVPILVYFVSLMGVKCGRGKPLFSLRPKKYEFKIETEEVFDYAPQMGLGEKPFSIFLIAVLLSYVAVIFML